MAAHAADAIFQASCAILECGNAFAFKREDARAFELPLDCWNAASSIAQNYRRPRNKLLTKPKDLPAVRVSRGLNKLPLDRRMGYENPTWVLPSTRPRTVFR